jgi:hypothetical protein
MLIAWKRLLKDRGYTTTMFRVLAWKMLFKDKGCTLQELVISRSEEAAKRGGLHLTSAGNLSLLARNKRPHEDKGCTYQVLVI